ncbi:MAG: fatty acid--CoA ligase family protein [Mycobacterium sp.]
MTISLILEMAASLESERPAIVDGDLQLTAQRLSELADHGAGLIVSSGAQHVAYVGTGGALLPTLIFSAARAGVAFSPLNYRLSAAALQQLIERLPGALVVADDDYAAALEQRGIRVTSSERFLQPDSDHRFGADGVDPEAVAIVLFTSGTTSAPKAVELSHQNLTSYVMGTVDFASAEPEDAALICVPPYHIAGVGAALSNLYAGRKLVYLRQFDPLDWLRLVREQAITTATVVPTMLDRIVSALKANPVDLPTLRNLAYGGSKVPLPLVRDALELLRGVGLVNAYGLTETSSTISVLTPEDHRLAHNASDETVARRLKSVGMPLPGVELQIRAEDGSVLGPGHAGELYVRGDQVSGSYRETGSALDAEGWFATKDVATLDDDGYLYITGRSDDTIIRGGENIAPAELEDVLVEHPDVRQCAVVGVDDPEWGQRIVAVVVPVDGAAPDAEQLRSFVRENLRGSRTPDHVVFVGELPTTPTGKVLRRAIIDRLHAEGAVPCR